MGSESWGACPRSGIPNLTESTHPHFRRSGGRQWDRPSRNLHFRVKAGDQIGLRRKAFARPSAMRWRVAISVKLLPCWCHRLRMGVSSRACSRKSCKHPPMRGRGRVVYSWMGVMLLSLLLGLLFLVEVGLRCVLRACRLRSFSVTTCFISCCCRARRSRCMWKSCSSVSWTWA